MTINGNGVVPSESLFHILHRAEQRAKLLFAEEAQGLDLTVRQLVILNVVSENENMMQTDIVMLTGIDRSTVTELVQRMVRRGLLTRDRKRSDARAYRVRITPEGRSRLRMAEDASRKAGERFLEAVPAEHRCKFIFGLQCAASI